MSSIKVVSASTDNNENTVAGSVKPSIWLDRFIASNDLNSPVGFHRYTVNLGLGGGGSGGASGGGGLMR
ncbi:hypothetical protein M0802_015660 [Mischocyttarus mexicanus]|nr:hypothetical protein M0802_015660 [Mischocyttarus mexicanus]